MKKKVFTAIGLMSGTSVDGIDLSIIKSDGYSKFEPVLDKYFDFEVNLREKILEFRDKISCVNDLKKNLSELNDLEKEITLFHSKLIHKTVAEFGEKIDFIGFHGQTIFHDSKIKVSKQLGDGNLLSQLSKSIVINDFRKADLENDGQGAPLTPIFHNLISKKINEKFNINFPISIINIGGITNITNIINDTSNFEASDIAPGNCLIDEWVRKNSKQKFDENGNIARSGTVNDLIYNQAVDNFNFDDYKKSLDINDFDISFVKGLSLEDGCATLTKFTAYLIVQGIIFTNKKNKNNLQNVFVCGGGRKNNFLIENIKEFLLVEKIKLEDIDSYGFNGDFVESQAFAYLAIRSFLKLPISFPSTTRCIKPTIGGVLNKNF